MTNTIKTNTAVIGIIYNGRTQRAIATTIVKPMAESKAIHATVSEMVRTILDKYNNRYHKSKPPLHSKSLVEFDGYWTEGARRKDRYKRAHGSYPMTAPPSCYARVVDFLNIVYKTMTSDKTEPLTIYIEDCEEYVRGANYHDWDTLGEYKALHKDQIQHVTIL